MGGTGTKDEEHGGLPAGRVLPVAFFAQPSDNVAAELVGKVLWRVGFGGGRLTEVEAYLPEEDPASHAAKGPTRRNAAMFGPPGHIYVFLSYGVHSLLNLVCDREGVGSAVLIRSYEPIAECRATGEVRGALGPGVVGRSLGIELAMTGMALGAESGVFVMDDGARPEVMRTSRVGITQGTALPLRHCKVGTSYVSGPARMSEGRGR